MSSPSTTLTLSNNTAATFDRSSRRRSSKKKKPFHAPHKEQQPQELRWRTDSQQQIYYSKLIQALSKVNLNPSSPSGPRRGRAVREAADRALAVSAQGRTLWSRAILTSRVKLKFRKPHSKKHQLRRVTSSSAEVVTRSPARKTRVSVLRLKGKKSLPAVQRKARVLGRLVPGCRKLPLPIILDEATDYIAALEMQIRTMNALAELLSGGGSSTSGSAPAPPPPSS